MKNNILFAGAAILALGGTAMAQNGMGQRAMPQSDLAAPGSTTMPDSTAPTGGTSIPGVDPAMGASSTAQQPTDAGASAATTTADASSSAMAGSTSGAGSTSAMSSGAGAVSAGTGTGAGVGDTTKMAAVQETVASGWATYDPDNKGSLTPLAFGKWVMAAQGRDVSVMVDKSHHARTANLPAVKVLNATAAEFSRADTNKDRTISRDELMAYLSA